MQLVINLTKDEAEAFRLAVQEKHEFEYTIGITQAVDVAIENYADVQTFCSILKDKEAL